MSIYNIKIKTIEGKDISMSRYRKKILLIMNSAKACCFTPQYIELQRLYEDFHDRGLEILDFPCNQFGACAPGTDQEIHDFCKTHFGITFPQFAKVNVNGDDITPLFQWLNENSRFTGFGDSVSEFLMWQMKKNGGRTPEPVREIRWNFTKFIIGRDGKLLRRAEPTVPVAQIRAYLETLI